jgi:hypothetical protein
MLAGRGAPMLGWANGPSARGPVAVVVVVVVVPLAVDVVVVPVVVVPLPEQAAVMAPASRAMRRSGIA